MFGFGCHFEPEVDYKCQQRKKIGIADISMLGSVKLHGFYLVYLKIMCSFRKYPYQLMEGIFSKTSLPNPFGNSN